MGDVVRLNFGKNSGDQSRQPSSYEPQTGPDISVPDEDLIRFAIDKELALKRAGIPFLGDDISEETYDGLVEAADTAKSLLTDQQQAYVSAAAQRIIEEAEGRG